MYRLFKKKMPWDGQLISHTADSCLLLTPFPLWKRSDRGICMQTGLLLSMPATSGESFGSTAQGTLELKAMRQQTDSLGMRKLLKASRFSSTRIRLRAWSRPPCQMQDVAAPLNPIPFSVWWEKSMRGAEERERCGEVTREEKETRSCLRRLVPTH